MTQTGPNLSLQSEAIYKGGVTDNGTLLKLHENSYTIGYAKLMKPDGSANSSVNFGNGAFLDASRADNVIYAGAPTTQGAAPVFAGIMVREPAIASGYPVINDKVDYFQNGLLVREGYVIYKEAYIGTASGSVGSEKEKLFGKVYQNFCMFVKKSDGAVYFAAKKTDGATGDFFVGKVVEVNPDDESVTVYIDPISLADTTSVAASTATLTLPTKTKNSIIAHVSVAMPATCVISSKVKSGGTFARDGEIELTLNAEGTAYEGDLEITGLAASTEYSVQVEAYTAIGYNKPAAVDGTTTA